MIRKTPEIRDVMRDAAALLERAKKERQARKDNLANEILEAKKRIETMDELRWQARRAAQLTQERIADEFAHIKKGELSYYAGKVWDARHVFRTMMASLDFSAALRQGGFLAIAKPEQQREAFAKMFNSIGERGFGRTIQDIEDHPLFDLALRAKLDFAVAGGVGQTGSLAGEELFKGEQTIEHIPILGKLIAEGVVKWSERTYTAFLDTQRMVTFGAIAQDMLDQGLTFQKNPEEFKAIAEFINIATGKGTNVTGRFGTVLMNLPLFAPRLAWSRLQLLNRTLNPVAYYNMPPHARKVIAKKAVRFYGTTMAILGLVTAFGAAIGASVNWDDDDEDFLKVKVGSTHYDIFAGELQPAKVIIRLIHSIIRTHGGMNPRVPGELFWDTTDAVSRFVRGKLDPISSLGWDYAAGTDYTGQPTQIWGDAWYKPGRALYSRIAPLMIGDTIDAYKTDGVVGIAKSVPATTFGIGASNYKGRPEIPQTEAEKLAAKAERWGLSSRDDADDPAIRQAKGDIRAMARNGQITRSAEVDQQIQQMVDAGKLTAAQADAITDRQRENIAKASTMSYLEDKAEGLKLSDLAQVMKVATPDERQRLIPMVNNKMKEAEINGTLTPDLQKQFESYGSKIAGYYPMPDNVKAEFKRLDIAIPDVGESFTRKGEKTVLNSDQYDRYRSETLKRIYESVQETIDDPDYRQEDADFQKKMLKRIISKSRNQTARGTKSELKEAQEDK
jgi:hypothetical protein